MRRCTRCLYDETIPAIVFDENGVCNYCKIHDTLVREYPIGDEGRRILEKMADEIRKSGRGHEYDVAVGVSGGCDSSYLLYLTKELGLRPLAVHFDNTWNSTVATENIRNVLDVLDVDLQTYVVANKEYDDIYRSFLAAATPDVDVPTDIALTTTLYKAAEENGIKHIFIGHSFRTEGIAPLGWVYMDGKYISDVHQRFGTLPMTTYPNLWLKDFIRWTAFRGIKRHRPLYYIDYDKKKAMEMLTADLNWQWYGGHHLENRFTAFVHTYFYPQRYGADTRLLGYSALVRSGQMTREEGLALINVPQTHDEELLEMVIKRLGYSRDEFDALMNLPKKTYRDYRSYKKTFERMRPFWWLMYRLQRVPKSFYMKWTKPDPPPS